MNAKRNCESQQGDCFHKSFVAQYPKTLPLYFLNFYFPESGRLELLIQCGKILLFDRLPSLDYRLGFTLKVSDGRPDDWRRRSIEFLDGPK